MDVKQVDLGVIVLDERAQIPEYKTEGSAGFDLHIVGNHTIYAGETKLIPTGLAFDIPSGYELQIRPRSGLSLKSKLRIANSPGTIDEDYTGHVQLIVENITDPDTIVSYINLKHGDRIAQAVLAPVTRGNIYIKSENKVTERGSGGFGHTGN